MFRFLAIEKIGLAWVVLTSVLMLFIWDELAAPWELVATRAGWLVSTGVLAYAGWRWAGRVTEFLRYAVALGWLAVWYPETYELNRWRQNLDHIFAQAEWSLFGCQPALELHQWLDSAVWSELFNLGYFSYFPMIIVLVVTLTVKSWGREDKSPGVPGRAKRQGRAQELDVPRVAAVILTSFFIYYIMYIALPVAGPQFYFAAIGIDNAAAGVYPAIGDYFNTHTEMLPAPGWSDGLFQHLVALTQASGERPTAAFPSSHIGVSTIILMLTWKYARRLTVVFAPLWLLLCGATVFIQAHYVVDAICGLLTAPVVLWLARLIVRALSPSAKETASSLLTL